MSKSLRELLKANSIFLKNMEDNNTRYLVIKSRLDSLVKDIKDSQEQINNMKTILRVLNEKRSQYSDDMIALITEAVQHAVNSVLVGKSYKVKLVPSVFRGKSIIKPYFVDEKGKHLPPKIVEGDMLNQVLSFSAVVILSYKSGYNWVFYDEAFASANVRSLMMIRQLLSLYIEMGINFVLVTQNPVLVYGLSRHVIDLESNGSHVSAVNEYDLFGENIDDNVEEALIDLFDSMSKGDDINGLFPDSSSK